MCAGKYVAIDLELSWADARAYCRAHHHDLASIHSDSENRQVVAACLGTRDHAHSTDDAHYCWIGLNDIEDEGTMVWSDHTFVDYSNWQPGQPNDFEHNCDTVQIWDRGPSLGLWLDNGVISLTDQDNIWADLHVGFVCEEPEPTGKFSDLQRFHIVPPSYYIFACLPVVLIDESVS